MLGGYGLCAAGITGLTNLTGSVVCGQCGTDPRSIVKLPYICEGLILSSVCGSMCPCCYGWIHSSWKTVYIILFPQTSFLFHGRPIFPPLLLFF
ncbi:hypothetical protein FKM82_026911 [Ascaphus truei]